MRLHRVLPLLLLTGMLASGVPRASARSPHNAQRVLPPRSGLACAAPVAATHGGALATPLPAVAPAREERLLDRLRAVNYFPAKHPWFYMWSQWDAKQLDADFGRIEALHANAVRLILQAGTIGYPTPYLVELNRLAQAISLANKHHLLVELTLFDWWSSYQDIKGSEQWACAVVGTHAGDPRIAFIELQNETDTTRPGAVAWVKTMVPYLRSIDGGIPVDLSAYSINDLHTLADIGRADFYSFHLIAGAESAYSTLRRAEQLVAPAPLYVGEVGTSTLLRWAPGHGCVTLSCSGWAQEHDFRLVAYAARQLGLPPIVPWTLTDFSPGSLTWRPPDTEYDFGLYQANGTAKPVAATVTKYFATDKVSLSFNNSFETPAGDIPAEWGEYHGWQARFAWDSTVAHTGHVSARISHSTSDASGGPAYFLSPIKAAVVPGHVYRLGAWARGFDATGTTRIAISWFDAQHRYLGEIQSPTLANGTTDWTHLAVSGPAPASAAFVQIHLKSFDNTGTAWFDDVSYS